MVAAKHSYAIWQFEFLTFQVKNSKLDNLWPKMNVFSENCCSLSVTIASKCQTMPQSNFQDYFQYKKTAESSTVESGINIALDLLFF